jgi:hypothetical protein
MKIIVVKSTEGSAIHRSSAQLVHLPSAVTQVQFKKPKEYITKLQYETRDEEA